MTLPPRLAVLEKGPFRSRFQTFLTAFIVAALYGWRFLRLQRELRAEGGFLDAGEIRALQLRRRFLAGAAAGFVASKDALSHRFGSPMNVVYADLCAYWSNCLIAADAATDLRASSHKDAAVLFAKSFAAMFTPVAANLPADLTQQLRRHHVTALGFDFLASSDCPAGPAWRFERYTIRMAEEIGRCIARLLAANDMTCFAGTLHQFYSRTLDLMAGQLAAYEQSIVEEDHDWGWYKPVMHNKFMNVLLAPLTLFADTRTNHYPEPLMRAAFHLLNRTFFHRQVLDDLMDFDEDLDCGIANSLIYILLSQGRVGAAFATRCKGGDATIVLQELRRSGLLTDPGADEEGCRRGGAGAVPDLDACVREVLVNRPADRALALEALASECAARRAALLDAWRRRDHGTVRAVVVRSGVAERILSTIAAGEHLAELENGLRRILREANVYGFVYLYYLRTLRTFERCVEKWRWHEPGTE
jgi:hypothetical protein